MVATKNHKDALFSEAMEVIAPLKCTSYHLFLLAIWEWARQNISIPRKILHNRWIACSSLTTMEDIANWYRGYLEVELLNDEISEERKKILIWKMKVLEMDAERGEILPELDDPSTDDSLVVLFVQWQYLDFMNSKYFYKPYPRRKYGLIVTSDKHIDRRTDTDIQAWLVEIASGLPFLDALIFFKEITIKWIRTLPRSDIYKGYSRSKLNSFKAYWEAINYSNEELSLILLDWFVEDTSHSGIEFKYIPCFYPKITQQEVDELNDI